MIGNLAKLTKKWVQISYPLKVGISIEYQARTCDGFVLMFFHQQYASLDELYTRPQQLPVGQLERHIEKEKLERT